MKTTAQTGRVKWPSGRIVTFFVVPGSLSKMFPGVLCDSVRFARPQLRYSQQRCDDRYALHWHGQRVNDAYGEADVMLAGGAEMARCGSGLGGCCSGRYDTPMIIHKPQASLGADRDGFVLSMVLAL